MYMYFINTGYCVGCSMQSMGQSRDSQNGRHSIECTADSALYMYRCSMDWLWNLWTVRSRVCLPLLSQQVQAAPPLTLNKVITGAGVHIVFIIILNTLFCNPNSTPRTSEGIHGAILTPGDV